MMLKKLRLDNNTERVEGDLMADVGERVKSDDQH